MHKEMKELFHEQLAGYAITFWELLRKTVTTERDLMVYYQQFEECVYFYFYFFDEATQQMVTLGVFAPTSNLHYLQMRDMEKLVSRLIGGGVLPLPFEQVLYYPKE